MTQQEYIHHHTEASVALLAEIILADREHLYITEEEWIPRGEERLGVLNVLNQNNHGNNMVPFWRCQTYTH